MQRCFDMSTLTCGIVHELNLPNMVTTFDQPLNLAEVSVNVRNIKNPCVLFNYSQNFAFAFFDFNPTISVVYRLVRKSNCNESEVILEEWNYRVSEVIPTTVDDINTIEPLVLNFCDCLKNNQHESYTYIVQLAELVLENTTFNIINQEISAIVSCGEK